MIVEFWHLFFDRSCENITVQPYPRQWKNPEALAVSDIPLKLLQWSHNVTASQITSLTIVYSVVYSGKSKKTPKLRVTGLCAGNSPGTGEFPAQMASYVENVSIWWRHHALTILNSTAYEFPPPIIYLSISYFKSFWSFVLDWTSFIPDLWQHEIRYYDDKNWYIGIIALMYRELQNLRTIYQPRNKLCANDTLRDSDDMLYCNS